MLLTKLELAPHRIVHRGRRRQQQPPLLLVVTVDLLVLNRLLHRKEGLHQLAIDGHGLVDSFRLHDLAESVLQRAPHIAGIPRRGAWPGSCASNTVTCRPPRAR